MDGTPSKNIDLDALVNSILKEKQGGSASAEEKAAPAEEKAAPVEEKPVPSVAESVVEQPVAAEAPVVEQPQPVVQAEPAPPVKERKKKRGGLFRSRVKEEDSEDEEWDEWGLKPIGHYRAEEAALAKQKQAADLQDAEEQEKRPLNDEFIPVKAVAETITMQVVLPSGAALPKKEAATRVISVNIPEDDSVAEPAPKPEPEPQPAEEQLPDQLSLEEMVRVEDIETDETPTEEEPMSSQERYERARQERVREFTLHEDEEEPNDPEEEAVLEEEFEPEDFTSYEETEAVHTELQSRARTALLSAVATGVLELVVLLFTLLTAAAGGVSPITSVGYLAVQAFALGLMLALNHTVVSHGLTGLFTLRANGDTPAALVGTLSLLGVLLHFLDDTQALPYWAPIAGLLLALSAIGQYVQAARVRRNFAFVSYPGEKQAAALIENEAMLRDIGRRVASDGETASIAYFHPTDFLSEYMNNAYAEDSSDDWSRWMAPAALGLSFLLSVIFLLTGHLASLWDWLSFFVGLVCVSMPCTRLAVQLPLSACCRYMLSRGGFLNGWKAVRDFGSPDALVVDIADLYPDESMLLHGIKTFAGAHIDDAILDAASLSVRAGGPLSMIFRRIIQNKEELLHEVDTLVYEQGMGLSGWVDGRRVLVGNRRLLENHGVDVPSSDYEARYAKDGRRLVYLSTAGELSAMFVVSYLIDPDIQSALQGLCRSHVTLLVRSCDPNITTEDLCDGFELDDYYVEVLSAAAGRQYVQLLQESASESAPAVMASNGHILGTARALSVCRSLQIKSFLALAVLALAAAVGLLLCTVWMLNSTLSVFQPLAFVVVTTLLSLFIPLFRHK